MKHARFLFHGPAAVRTLGVLAAAVVFFLSAAGWCLELKPIKLNQPDKKRGLPFMEALSVKASAQDWSEKDLSLEDLSDLMWAANGINRPDVKKYTASSAMNAHDVDLYVFMKDGVFLYDADTNSLNPILQGDFRSEIVPPPPPRPRPAGDSTQAPPKRPTPSTPPVLIVLVSETARFRVGSPELKQEWGAIDTGIVSQNISLFCAATGLKTRPRASMDRDKIRKLLNLKETQYPFLNHPVGYAK